jgi:hypothetical protein
MNLKMNEKDKKTLKLGGLGIVGIIILLAVLKGYDRWNQARESFATLVDQVNLLDVKDAQREGMLKIVPVFEMPVAAAEQRDLFRKKLNEQLGNIGISTGPFQEITSGGKPLVAGYQLLRLKGSGTCNFNQVLNLLAVMKENPYLVGIEELRVTVQSNSSRGGLPGQGARGTTAGAAGGRGGAGAAGGMAGGGRGGGSSNQTEFEFTVSTLTK